MKYDKKVALSRDESEGWSLKAKLLLIGLLIFFTFFSAAVGTGIGIIYSFSNNLPSLAPLEDYTAAEWNLPTKIYCSEGELLATFSEEQREIVSIEELPQELIQAAIAVEDNRFFRHSGVDFHGIARAAYQNFRAGSIVEGGSTITQQLSKVLFLTPRQTFRRKIREALLALKIERNYTKREILERYFNKIYFGGGAYGVETASQVYFGKSAREVDVVEAALLAGLPRAPSRYSPVRNPELARERHWIVLNLMARRGLIETEKLPEKFEEFWDDFEYRHFREEDRKEEEIYEAPYFVESVRRYLLANYGPDVVYRGGLEVHTTLHRDYQQKLQEEMHDYLVELNIDRGNLPDTATEIPTEPDTPIIEGAAIARNPQTGHIKGMVGGHRWHTENQLNRALQSHRQPGSAFKPILYAAALDNGYTQTDKLYDMPLSFETPQGRWEPKNYSGRFYGEVLLRDALAESLNLATVDLMNNLGPEKVVDYARKLGLQSPLQQHMAIALGGLERGTSLLDMVNIYSVFANQGVKTNAIFVSEIRDRENNILERNFTRRREAISPQTAYLVTDMLKGAVDHGTGRRIGRTFERPVAGKTGTTNNFRDAWFIGYTPQLVLGSWFGYDQQARSLGENMSGGVVAGEFWRRAGSKIYSDMDPISFPVPGGITYVNIDRETGYRATPHCPNTIRLPFRSGTAPTRSCPEHGTDGRYVLD